MAGMSTSVGEVVVGTGPVGVEELVAVARHGAPVVLGEDALAAVARGRAAVEELYVAALSRRPTDVERSRAEAFVADAADKQKALEDVLWALLNSREFMFNH